MLLPTPLAVSTEIQIPAFSIAAIMWLSLSSMYPNGATSAFEVAMQAGTPIQAKLLKEVASPLTLFLVCCRKFGNADLLCG